MGYPPQFPAWSAAFAAWADEDCVALAWSMYPLVCEMAELTALLPSEIACWVDESDGALLP